MTKRLRWVLYYKASVLVSLIIYWFVPTALDGKRIK